MATPRNAVWRENPHGPEGSWNLVLFTPKGKFKRILATVDIESNWWAVWFKNSQAGSSGDESGVANSLAEAKREAEEALEGRIQ